MEIILWIVVINWGAPILTWFYPLVMTFIFKDFEFIGFHGPFAKFRLLGGARVWWKGTDGTPKGGYELLGCDGHTYYLKSDDEDAPGAVPKDELNFMEPWHVKWWRGWGGVGLYWFMCYRDRVVSSDDAWVKQTIVHEGVHCWQWAILGLLFPISYLLHMLWILVTQRFLSIAGWRTYQFPTEDGWPFRHPYLDCWAERMARKRAGQQVDIPPQDWPQGKNDLWPWW